MTAPLTITFDVDCSAEHAFTTWTEDISTWWPADHTASGLEGLVIVLEAGVGGRIYERTPDGVEHDWGQVTAWEPPCLLAYRWHLRQDRANTTDVEIRFVATGPAATRIEIEHSGWDALGPVAAELLQRNRAGWDSLLPYYVTALTSSRTKE
jgi:uncharacterized protein YndB with AHSA1/START domain